MGLLGKDSPPEEFPATASVPGEGAPGPHVPLPVKAQAWPRAARKATGPFPEAQVQARPRARPPCRGRGPPPPREAVVQRWGGDPRAAWPPLLQPRWSVFPHTGFGRGWDRPPMGQATCGTGHPWDRPPVGRATRGTGPLRDRPPAGQAPCGMGPPRDGPPAGQATHRGRA